MRPHDTIGSHIQFQLCPGLRQRCQWFFEAILTPAENATLQVLDMRYWIGVHVEYFLIARIQFLEQCKESFRSEVPLTRRKELQDIQSVADALLNAAHAKNVNEKRNQFGMQIIPGKPNAITIVVVPDRA